MSDETELAALERNLRNATEELEKANMREGAARRARCDAQNAVNAAQRQLDAYIETLRTSAPADTDWAIKRMKPVRCA